VVGGSVDAGTVTDVDVDGTAVVDGEVRSDVTTDSSATDPHDTNSTRAHVDATLR
jgi:hypothetical protein